MKDIQLIKKVLFKMKALWNWIKNHLLETLAIIVALFGIVLASFFSKSSFVHFLFGYRNISPSEIITYFGVAAGGIILLRQLFATDKRIDLQDESNRIQAKGQLDTRFKDASMLLGSENTSSILAGVYALHQVAVEASQSEQKGYVTVVKNILCAFLRENSEVVKDGEKEEASDEKTKALKRKKPDIVFQSIVNVLFKEPDYTVYKGTQTDLKWTCLSGLDLVGAVLPKAVLSKADLREAELPNASLRGAYLNGVNLHRANLRGAYLLLASLQDADLSRTRLSEADLCRAQLPSANLKDAVLCNANLSEARLPMANLSGADLSKTDLSNAELQRANLEGANLKGANLKQVDFSLSLINKDTDFTGTIHEGKTVAEIKAYKPRS
ncbi:MAG: pentapeptide repeat-containing protein [Tannerella sp.]|jgi:hypothetical protein|nr:pentapeptide repeat-containing protein [Tannerella sp.]